MKAALTGKTLEAKPKFEGDGSQVKRNLHHTHAVGKGDPQVFSGQAGEAKFRVGDTVRVRELPALFYTRTPEYVRGDDRRDRDCRLREPGTRGRGV